MGDSSVTVALKARCFVATKIGGVEAVLFVERLDAGGVELRITSPKKVQALRVYQELPGFEQAAAAPRPAPPIAGQVDDAAGKRRAS